MGRMRKIAIAAAMGAAFMVVPATALAQTPAQDAYDTPGGSVQEALPPPPNPVCEEPNGCQPPVPPPPTITEARGGSLPFTGLDLGLMVGAGGVLLALGLGMRRLSRPASEIT